MLYILYSKQNGWNTDWNHCICPIPFISLKSTTVILLFFGEIIKRSTWAVPGPTKAAVKIILTSFGRKIIFWRKKRHNRWSSVSALVGGLCQRRLLSGNKSDWWEISSNESELPAYVACCRNVFTINWKIKRDWECRKLQNGNYVTASLINHSPSLLNKRYLNPNDNPEVCIFWLNE